MFLRLLTPYHDVRQGSTVLWEELSPMDMDAAMRLHAITVRHLLLVHQGCVHVLRPRR